MIWIHGGGFIRGSGMEDDPSAIVTSGDVVVVTINYRVGALGFMSTGDKKLPGNYGLWDQKLAIEWVKDNIKDYGGNPDSITIFGQSAGSISATFQMLSPLNNNTLFQRVIAQSGSALAAASISRTPAFFSQSVLQRLNCSSTAQPQECLSSKTSEEIMAATSPRFNLIFYPVVDQDFLHYDGYEIMDSFARTGLSETTKSMLANFGSFDLFSGWTDQEGLFGLLVLLRLVEEVNFSNIQKGLSAETLREALKVPVFRDFVAGAEYYNATEEEKQLSQRMIQQWTSFAKTGDPSNTDYTEFEYPSTQAYTRLKTGEFEKLSYPYSSQAKILLAINSAAMNNAEVENKVNLEETTPAGISMSTEGNPKNDYLNGLLQLTAQEADFAITTTLVLSVLLAIICIILIGVIIHLKRKSNK
ncbi:CEL [Bugula neritina]|uniref:CEL n=1 Tax=Bugula neritina TaxID=10212 RepID=A0A7J7IZF0_BUGNE|nr:CEL [Bugula neritina]